MSVMVLGVSDLSMVMLDCHPFLGLGKYEACDLKARTMAALETLSRANVRAYNYTYNETGDGHVSAAMIESFLRKHRNFVTSHSSTTYKFGVNRFRSLHYNMIANDGTDFLEKDKEVMAAFIHVSYRYVVAISDIQEKGFEYMPAVDADHLHRLETPTA